jgi:hypothetical protein
MVIDITGRHLTAIDTSVSNFKKLARIHQIKPNVKQWLDSNAPTGWYYYPRHAGWKPMKNYPDTLLPIVKHFVRFENDEEAALFHLTW